MRIQYKGGIWKNSEDEILKASVMKYGMNQWARIASLLVRKSAKQCKARWYEWLDPSIKKTAWTQQEEEQLLHLAKIMPTQWRSIAPMIGRTAAQCLEHYEKLLDEAQRDGEGETGSGSGAGAGAGAGAGSSGAGPSSDPRRGAREGDIAPESKPARPDPVDMDEDELEMLGEARARLANTKGKKAKRKAREKQLAVAKRIAHLQKRRELKAAGIEMKPRKRDRKEPDLAVEIPFQRAPAPGFYDTREEDEKAANLRTDVGKVGRLLEKYEGQRYDEIERVRRKNDAQRRKEYEERDLPAALGLVPNPAAADLEAPLLQGTTLNLPKPQVSDAELEAIAKAGALFAAKTKHGPQSGVTDRLVPERNPVLGTPSSVAGSSASFATTPRTNPSESWADTRQRHVETILNLQNADTPLVGGQNTPLPTRISQDPSASVTRTPNPLSTPSELSFASEFSGKRLTKARKAKLALLRKQVQSRLDTLAAPDNEYQFDIDTMQADLENEIAVKDGENGSDEMVIVEDAEAEAKRLKKEGRLKLARAKCRFLSKAALQHLPLPEEGWVKSPDFPESLRLLVLRDIEVTKILQRSESTANAASVADAVERAGREDIAPDLLRQARALIDAESAANPGDVSVDDYLAALNTESEESKWVVQKNNDIVIARSGEDTSRLLSAREVHMAQAQKGQHKLLKKLDLVTKGFQRRLATAESAIVDEWGKLADLEQQIACVSALEEMEKVAVVNRVKDLENAVQEQKDRHVELQKEYAQLSDM